MDCAVRVSGWQLRGNDFDWVLGLHAKVCAWGFGG